MPADFTSSGFVEITTCDKSGGHGGKYVNTWVSAEAHEAWKAGTLPFAVDTVFVKEGFSDAKCTERSSYWAMKKVPAGSGGKAGDWSWQQLDADGVVESEGQVGGCTGCHSGYAANDYVGTKGP